jgi:hypothetical protein
VSVTVQNEDLLLKQFIVKFEQLDELVANEFDPIAWQLRTGPADQYGYQAWRPIEAITDAASLEPIYAKVPARFPRLFERMLLSYRWAEVHLPSFTLFGNPPGTDLSGWLKEISRDAILWDFLLRAGYIPFAKGPDMDYDRVCFDLKSRKKNRDAKIVKIDHEQILCNDRLRIVAEVAPSFRELVQQTIDHKN